MRIIERVRWLIVAFLAVFGFYLSFILGMAFYVVANYMCPNNHMVSGMCTAPWHNTVMDAFLILCPVLGAVLVVGFSFFIAPKHKAKISKLVYLIGCGVSFYIAYMSSHWWAFLAVIVAGFMTLLLINKQFNQLR
ncbi:hypothetical protein Q4489_08170 [Thalassotalea sp. 1_MG-2023]|uniref:hypothetical protein n=1 Tax=Thalassotalea sp. 1_MG-2023 TaxID=3062680 RepID=UPI0026E20DEC|nr:hypothetical protein [Thalassotalea sp. 1_MG-2023]MDO6426982.1 hypothetical protein [Thalassotalea sp. 1_MG-2023]